MKAAVILAVLMVALSMASTATAQPKMPPDIREVAIADLNARVSGVGRPASWQYQIITSDNSNLGCNLVASGRSITPILRVFVITLNYPNGVSYVYHVSSDAQRVIACDRKLINVEPQAGDILAPTAMAPANPAQYGYQSTTCPAGLSAYTQPRLQIGGFGLSLVAGETIFLHETFDRDSTIVSSVPPLQVFYVLAGPECSQSSLVWWQVELNGTVGWLTESRVGNFYFVDVLAASSVDVAVPPTFTPTVPPSPTPTPTATLTPSPTATFTPSMTPTASPIPLPVASARAVIAADNAANLALVTLRLLPVDAAAWVDTESQSGLLWLSGGTLRILAGDGLLDSAIEQPEGELVDFAIDGDYLISQFIDGRVRATPLDPASEGRSATYAEGDLGAIQSLGSNSSGLFGATFENNDTYIWTTDPAEWNTPDGLLGVIPHANPVREIVFNAAGTVVVTLDGEEVYGIRLDTGETFVSYRFDGLLPEDCGGVGINTNNTLFFADCNTLYRLSVDSTDVNTILSLEDHTILEVAPHPSSAVVALRTDSQVLLVDSDTGDMLFAEDLAADQVLFSPDGTVLTVISFNGIEFWAVVGG